MENVIELSKSNGMWVATFGGPHARQIEELFGTATLPTPFGAITDANMVLNAIMTKNPGVRIVMA